MDALRLRLPRALLSVAVLALAGNVLVAGRLMADETPSCCPMRAGDQLWLVSDRGLGCQVGRQATNLKYWRYDRETGWARSDLAELQAAESEELVTTIFVHGNRISRGAAFAKGWSAYRALVRSADERPIRVIIWSWPSNAIKGIVQDVRVKAARTNRSAYYLAWFVDKLNPQTPLGLWGHSFGARIVTGALEVLAGGQIAGRRLVDRAHATRDPVKVVLVAAALDNNWLARGRYHGRAMSQVDRMLLVNNSCDYALRRYHWIYHRRACQQALGYTGLRTGWLDESERGKIEQVDACCQVGRQHTLVGYLCAANLMARMRRVLLFEPSGTPVAEPETLAVADSTSAE